MPPRNGSSPSSFNSREEYEHWKAQHAAGSVPAPEQPIPPVPEAPSRVRMVDNRIVIDPPLPYEIEQDRRQTVNVVITDIDMPFWSVVSFIVECSVAMIPAAIVLALLGGGLTVLLSAMGIAFLGGGK